MPFAVEDIRVLCHTKNASRIHGRLSGAEWVLSSPVMPPNPNYKIKMHITTMQVPNSFEHVGPRQNNDTIVILKRWSSESTAEAIARGDYITVTISTKDGHIANVRDYFESLGTLEKGINNKIMEVCRFKPGWAQSKFVPQLRIDKRGFPLLYVREVFMGTNDKAENSKFDNDDITEEPVYDGLNSMVDIERGINANDDSPWVFFTEKRIGVFREVNWHTQPFFLFNRKTISGDLRGFGFVIRGKNILGKIPFQKEAFFIKNNKEPAYQPPFREDGYYPIEEDAYYMVVAMVDGDTGLSPVPEFKGGVRDIPDGRLGALLQAGDLRIFQLPTRPATQAEITDNAMVFPNPELQIVGPTLLIALDSNGRDYSESDEEDEHDLDEWHIFGYAGKEADQDLDQAPHLHVKKNGFDLWDPPAGADVLFDNGFKEWYYRWGAHLYNSVTSTTVALARYAEFNGVNNYIQRFGGLNNEIGATGADAKTPTVVYPRTQFGDTPFMDYEYKIITGYDLNNPEKYNFKDEIPTGLAEIIGFTRFVYTPGVNVPNTDLVYLSSPGMTFEPLTPMPRDASRSDDSRWIDHVVTQAPCDFSGVRFIKLYTNMNISSIDSDGRDSRLLAIMPTVGTSAMESNYLVGALQGSQTFTLADTKIDRIRFDLTDDNNIPIEMYRDWWVDLTFSFEEPFNVDFYQGIAKIINIGTRYTTEGYKYDDYSTITKDIGDEMDRVVSAETRNRRGNADLGTKRKHGYGGY
jgi:hypothetical protein